MVHYCHHHFDIFFQQYCGQYYETAARILTEFNRKNGDIINEYGQKFSEVKYKNLRIVYILC